MPCGCCRLIAALRRGIPQAWAASSPPSPFAPLCADALLGLHSSTNVFNNFWGVTPYRACGRWQVECGVTSFSRACNISPATYRPFIFNHFWGNTDNRACGRSQTGCGSMPVFLYIQPAPCLLRSFIFIHIPGCTFIFEFLGLSSGSAAPYMPPTTCHMLSFVFIHIPGCTLIFAERAWASIFLLPAFQMSRPPPAI